MACFLLYLFCTFVLHRIVRRCYALTLRGTHLRVGILPLRLGAPLSILLLVAWSIVLAPFLNDYLGFTTYVNGRLHKSVFIEQEYVDPATTQIRFSTGQKRNLINIYLESAETTFQDVQNGGDAVINYIPELTRLACEHTSFSQSDLIQGAAVTPGANWTIGALVAQTSGLPLKLSIDGNGGDKLATFLPGATTLGDILHANGYRTVFMCGSDFTFGGRRQYFTQHGNYEIWDFPYIRQEKLVPEDYPIVGWGLADKDLYEIARVKLSQLAEGEQPFHFSLLTVDTHIPGYPCDLCPDTIADPLVRATACASRQVDTFIRWCQEQPFYENTTIVVTGDHAAMTSLQQLEGFGASDIPLDRLVYNVFINPAVTAVRETNRRFTTLDFFPTTLAAIGVTIEGDRLGLGTNLFGERETLSEQYGYGMLFDELNKVSTFYNEQLLYP